MSNIKQWSTSSRKIHPQVSRWLAVFLRKSLALGLFSIIRAGTKYCNFLAKEYWIGVFSMSFLMKQPLDLVVFVFFKFPTTEIYFLPLQLISDQIPTFLPHFKFPTYFRPSYLPGHPVSGTLHATQYMLPEDDIWKPLKSKCSFVPTQFVPKQSKLGGFS